MNNYLEQTKGKKIFNHLSKDIPIIWIWTSKDFLSLAACVMLAGSGFQLGGLFSMILVTLIIPVVRHKYGIQIFYQPFLPNFRIKNQLLFNGARLRD